MPHTGSSQTAAHHSQSQARRLRSLRPALMPAAAGIEQRIADCCEICRWAVMVSGQAHCSRRHCRRASVQRLMGCLRGAHWWRLDRANHGVCRGCGQERNFAPICLPGLRGRQFGAW